MDPMNIVSSREMARRVPGYPYAPLGALNDIEAVNAADVRKLAVEMSALSAISLVAAGAAGYGLAWGLKRNRGEALQAALVGWFGSAAVHFLYYAAKK